MAKYTGSLGFKGLVTQVDGDFIIVEERKINKDTTIKEYFNLSEQLREYIGKNVSLTVKEDTELEPIETEE